MCRGEWFGLRVYNPPHSQVAHGVVDLLLNVLQCLYSMIDRVVV